MYWFFPQVIISQCLQTGCGSVRTTFANVHYLESLKLLNVTSIFAKSVPRQPYVTKPQFNLRHRYTNMISTFPQVKIQNVLVDINTWAVSFHI